MLLLSSKHDLWVTSIIIFFGRLAFQRGGSRDRPRGYKRARSDRSQIDSCICSHTLLFLQGKERSDICCRPNGPTDGVCTVYVRRRAILVCPLSFHCVRAVALFLSSHPLLFLHDEKKVFASLLAGRSVGVSQRVKD